MRGLTTRNVRPRLQHGRYGCSLPLSRCATSPPLHRAVTCADAFLFFLPSVLTAALVIDYTGKERRRAEWDRQIALAQEEAEALKRRQLEAWSRIQRRSVSNGAWQQRRTLFTAASELVRERVPDDTEEAMDPLDRRDEINTADREPDSQLEAKKDATTDDNVQTQIRFGRLLATRLALEMMLKLRLGKSIRYTPQVAVDVDSSVYHQSLDYISKELERVTQLMRALEIQNVPWDIDMPNEYRQKQEAMRLRLMDLVKEYREVEIHLPDFVMSFVRLVAEFKISPSNQAYVAMLRALSFQQQEGMARHVEDTILDSHERLDSYTISNILFYHGIGADSFRFGEFLKRLTRTDHHPRSLTPWYQTNVNDTNICIPSSKDGHLISNLMRAALRCRQTAVAEAYGMVFIDRERTESYTPVHKWFVLSTFLQSYGSWSSWEAGKRWLGLAMAWLSDLATEEEHVLGRVILRMLDFCVACGKHEDYEAIMRAVVAANMTIPRYTPGKQVQIADRMRAIRLDWKTRIERESWGQPPQHGRTNQERAAIFGSLLEGRWESDPETIKDKRHPPAMSWTEPGTLAYHPFIAADRMEKAIDQRREQILLAFTDKRARLALTSPSKFPLSGEHNTWGSEPDVEYEVSTSESGEFTSPFFQPMNQSSTPPPGQSAPAPTAATEPDTMIDQPTDESDPSVRLLERAVQDAEAALSRVQDMERAKVRELGLIRRRLEWVRKGSRNAKQQPPTSPAGTAADNDEDTADRWSAVA